VGNYCQVSRQAYYYVSLTNYIVNAN